MDNEWLQKITKHLLLLFKKSYNLENVLISSHTFAHWNNPIPPVCLATPAICSTDHMIPERSLLKNKTLEAIIKITTFTKPTWTKTILDKTNKTFFLLLINNEVFFYIPFVALINNLWTKDKILSNFKFKFSKPSIPRMAARFCLKYVDKKDFGWIKCIKKTYWCVIPFNKNMT